MDKLLVLFLCVGIFYWGYYDYPSSKMKSNPEDTQFEKYYKKITNFRSLIMIVMSVIVFVVLVISIVLEWCDK